MNILKKLSKLKWNLDVNMKLIFGINYKIIKTKLKWKKGN